MGKPSLVFDLNVVICEPQFGNHHHWALQLHNVATNDVTVFELRGQYPDLEYATYQCWPTFYELKILKKIRVYRFIFTANGLDDMAQAIGCAADIENHTEDWTSQDFVIDALDVLEEEWWLDGNDDECAELRRKLKDLSGPIDEVHNAVLAYPDSPTTARLTGGVPTQQPNAKTSTKRTRAVHFIDLVTEDPRSGGAT